MAPIPENSVTDDKSRCWPIKTLEALLAWTYDCVNTRAVAEPLAQFCQVAPKNAPRTMICHDHAGGYHEDSYIDGIANVDGYRMQHWAYIDVFCYFSHYFVTIPPVGWTNCAHRNGVLMLGTFIMEWKGGAKTMEHILATPQNAEKVAGLLAAIAEAYKFEGWLMNFECEVKVEQMPNLILFLTHLQKGCRDRLGPQSMVVWYDSVLYQTGELDWQNELNGFNRPFYDVCDAIYLNYGWKSANLKASILNAGTRPLTEVYVGIDVYGRGQIGGGGFNCCYSLQLIREFGFSVAIFAPAWVKEAFKDPNFKARASKFWDLLAPTTVCSKISSLPVETNFCDGYFMIGQAENYFNLSCAQLQPHYCCLREDLPDGYNARSGRSLSGVEQQLERIDCQVKAAAEKLKAKSSPIDNVETNEVVEGDRDTDLDTPVQQICIKNEPANVIESSQDDANKVTMRPHAAEKESSYFVPEAGSAVQIQLANLDKVEWSYDPPIRCGERGLEIRLKPGLSEIRLFCTQIPLSQIKSILFPFRVIGVSTNGDHVNNAGNSSLCTVLHLRVVGSEPWPSQSEFSRDILIGHPSGLASVADQRKFMSDTCRLELREGAEFMYDFNESNSSSNDFDKLKTMGCHLIWISLLAQNIGDKPMYITSNKFVLT